MVCIAWRAYRYFCRGWECREGINKMWDGDRDEDSLTEDADEPSAAILRCGLRLIMSMERRRVHAPWRLLVCLFAWVLNVEIPGYSVMFLLMWRRHVSQYRLMFDGPLGGCRLLGGYTTRGNSLSQAIEAIHIIGDPFGTERVMNALVKTLAMSMTVTKSGELPSYTSFSKDENKSAQLAAAYKNCLKATGQPLRDANIMWRKLLYAGFLFMIGHSLGRVETCFSPSTQGAGIRYQNTSEIQILLASHSEKKGRDIECEEPACGRKLKTEN